MYDMSAQGVDERIISVYYYYYYNACNLCRFFAKYLCVLFTVKVHLVRVTFKEHSVLYFLRNSDTLMNNHLWVIRCF